MNCNCYKVIFSKRLGTLVAVGEHTASTGKAASGQASRGGLAHASFGANGFVGALRLSFASVALACLSLGVAQAQTTRPAPASNALPSGGTLNTGSATISTNGAQMAINQTSDKASINWNSFNIGSAASVNIAQPSTSSVLLNRVVGQDPSQIFGKLSANGQVILLNPNGMVFGRDGSVTASSFTASTFNLTDADFMSGFYKYNRNGSNAAIVNEGTIETSAGGFVALIGASVTNDGKIIAPQGNVVMVAAESVTLPDTLTSTTAPSPAISVPLSRKVRLELSSAAVNTAVNNTQGGVIVTEGGQVLLQAAALSSAVASVTHSGLIDTSGTQGGAVQVLAENGNIRVDGSIKSNSTGNSNGQNNRGGDIIIGRDEDTGVLAKFTDVSGAKLESQGGFVETSGEQLRTTGVSVKAGEWLLDPTDITIVSADTASANTPKANAGSTDTYQQTDANNSSEILNTDISTALSAGTNVLIKTTNVNASGNGDITVASNIAVTGATDATLTLQAERDIVVNSNVSIARTGSNKLNVVLNSDLDGNGAGAIVMNTGSSIGSNGGNITLGGGSTGDGSGNAVGNSTNINGISLNSSTLTAAGGNISLKGQSGSVSTDFAAGISVINGTTVSTNGAGTVSITGTGAGIGTSSQSMGVRIAGTDAITLSNISSGLGNITITGTGTSSATGNYEHGVMLTNAKVSAAGGNVSLTGTGGSAGTGNSYKGISIETGGEVSTTGAGTVTLTGTGGISTGAPTGNNSGVSVNSGASIKSETGLILSLIHI